MIRRNCKLTRASMYFMGGGGGGGSSQLGPGGTRTPSKEKDTINNWYANQQDQFNQFVAGNPLLSAAQGGALGFWKQLPGMLSQFKGFGNEISGDQSQIQGYQGQLQNVYGGLGGLLNQLPGLMNQTSGLAAPFSKFLAPGSALNDAYKDNASTLRNEGALDTEALRNATQLSRSMSPSGTSNDPSAIARDVLSREDFRQQNLNRALGVSQNILGQQTGATGVLSGLLGQKAGLFGEQAGVAGQGAGLSGLLAGLTGQKAGLLGQEQGMQTAGLNQLLGVGNAATSQFGSLTNPVLGYLGNLFSGNQQAAISQAQINAQQNAAGQAKTGSSIGGGLSLIGSIAGIAL